MCSRRLAASHFKTPPEGRNQSLFEPRRSFHEFGIEKEDCRVLWWEWSVAGVDFDEAAGDSGFLGESHQGGDPALPDREGGCESRRVFCFCESCGTSQCNSFLAEQTDLSV